MIKKLEPQVNPIIENTSEEGLAEGMVMTGVNKKRLLLHSCCGPCSTACIERVLGDYKITVFFYNPNITDPEEYEKRKAAQIKFLNEYNDNLAEEEKVEFIEGEYLPEEFFNVAACYADVPEGGANAQSVLNSD